MVFQDPASFVLTIRASTPLPQRSFPCSANFAKSLLVGVAGNTPGLIDSGGSKIGDLSDDPPYHHIDPQSDPIDPRCTGISTTMVPLEVIEDWWRPPANSSVWTRLPHFEGPWKA